MDIKVGLGFIVRHRSWTIPMIWLALVTMLTAGAITAGFDSPSLPWIGGVLGVVIAGFLAGIGDVLRGRAAGWLGIAGWLPLPVLHLLVASRSSGGWALTLVVDLIGVMLALMCAGVAIVAALLPARGGSAWEALDAEAEVRPPQPRVPASPGAVRLGVLASVAAALVGLMILLWSVTSGETVGWRGSIDALAGELLHAVVTFDTEAKTVSANFPGEARAAVPRGTELTITRVTGPGWVLIEAVGPEGQINLRDQLRHMPCGCVPVF